LIKHYSHILKDRIKLFIESDVISNNGYADPKRGRRIAECTSDFHVLYPHSPIDAQFALESVYLDHGETLIGFTDGITDACSNSGERFCRSGIGATIQGSCEPSEKLMKSIIDGVFEHLDGCELTDDIAMISISRMPKA
jgi:hypothetical protein